MLRPPISSTRPSAIQALWCMRRFTLQNRNDHFDAAQQRALAAAQRIEQPDLDVGVAVERPVVGIATPGVDVVEQQPDAHAPVGGGNHLPRQKTAGQIVLPVVVLQVEAALGPARGGCPQREGFDIVGHEPQPGLAVSGAQSAERRPGRATTRRPAYRTPRTRRCGVAPQSDRRPPATPSAATAMMTRTSNIPRGFPTVWLPGRDRPSDP